MKATVYHLNPETREWIPDKVYPTVDSQTFQRLQSYAEEFGTQVNIKYEREDK